MWRLLVAHYTPRPNAVRLTTDQHVQALTRVPDAEVLSYNAVHGLPSWLRALRFDAIVLHTTLLALRWHPYFEQWKPRSDWLAEADCLKIAFPQDEYWHAETLDSWLDELGAGVVCTVLDDRHREALYPRLVSKAAFYETLTGYIDEAAAKRIAPRLAPRAERPFDLVYRARSLPYWLGSHGQLKHRIGEAASARAPAHGLHADISTRPHGTLLGDAWLDFMGSGRGTVGAESGASTLDRTGDLEAKVEHIVAAEPDLTFEQLDARMPPGWDDYEFFAISPRHLEAVITKTAQILVEGRYSGALEPELHYLPVKRDLSDLDDALERARDVDLLDELAERAYEDVYRSGRYASRQLTATLTGILETHAVRNPRRLPLAPAARIARVEEEVERMVVEPLANLFRAGRDGRRELLAAVRLVGHDPVARRLLAEYLRSSEAREHVSPRLALGDLFCLSAARRRGHIAVELDLGRRRVVLGAPNETPPTRQELEERLAAGAWDFVWDHDVDSLTVPLLGSASLEVELGDKPRPLAVLSWLARARPSSVASALTQR
jgi:hypothetical protein